MLSLTVIWSISMHYMVDIFLCFFFLWKKKFQLYSCEIPTQPKLSLFYGAYTEKINIFLEHNIQNTLSHFIRLPVTLLTNFLRTSGGSVPESVSTGNTVIGSRYWFHQYSCKFWYWYQ